MRAVVQRVSHCRVTVDGNAVGEIGHGLIENHVVPPADLRLIPIEGNFLLQFHQLVAA